MSFVGIAWVLVIVLKIAGLAFLTTSWFWVILWPLIPIVIVFILFMVFGIGAALIPGKSYKR